MNDEKHAAHELSLWAVNTQWLYRKHALPLLQRLASQQRRLGKGNPRYVALVTAQWQRFAELAAQAYVREFPEYGQWFKAFPPAARAEAAITIREHYAEHLRELAAAPL